MTHRSDAEGSRPPSDPLLALAELTRLRLDEHTPGSVLDRVVTLAREAVPGADEVSVTLGGPGEPSTAASTGDLALSADQDQYESGSGPCLDATQGETVLVPDLSTDARWPGYAERALARGVRSSLSLPISLPETKGAALNIYARRAGAFDDRSRELAQSFASYASVALANAHLYASTRRLAEQLHTAMQSRAVIEQAKGILMSQQRCSADRAFDLLVKASQRSHTKLHDVARKVVEGTSQPG